MDAQGFFESVLGAGAILTGFCGTFLTFRIQREAGYHRQPALSYSDERAVDVHIGLSQFSSSFLLLIMATLSAIIFGLSFPLIALAGCSWAFARPELVVAGLLATLILLVGYFFNELVHYRIVSSRLVSNAREWGEEKWIVIVTILTSFGIAYWLISAA